MENDISQLWEKVYTEREFEGKYDNSHSWKMTIGLLVGKFIQIENMKAPMIIHIHGK